MTPVRICYRTPHENESSDFDIWGNGAGARLQPSGAEQLNGSQDFFRDLSDILECHNPEHPQQQPSACAHVQA